MVGVVGYEEARYLAPFALVLFGVRQFEAAVFHAVVGLHGLASHEFQLRWVKSVAVGNGEVNHVTLLPVGRVEAARPEKYVHHVVDTLAGSHRALLHLAVLVQSALCYLALSARIAVPHLVYGVAFSFERSLAVASGVAGGSLLLIPMACSLFGIPNDIAMQVVGVGFIIGVIQDSVETALNSSSDLLLSASAEFRQWRLEGKEILF